MEGRSLAFAAYWRSSLADADLDSGALTNRDVEGLKQRPIDEFEQGCVGADLTTEFFEGENTELEFLDVILRPYVYRERQQHGQPRLVLAPDRVTPIVGRARLDRRGRIYPSSNTIIPRDILEPLNHGSFSIGSVSDLDKWLESNQVPVFNRSESGFETADTWHSERWQEYRRFCKKMINEAVGWPSKTEPFYTVDCWYIVKKTDASGAGLHILDLYSHLIKTNPPAPLFDTYASDSVAEPEPCSPPNTGFSLRLGHSSSEFPLTDAQRDALTHQLVSRHGEILAVNGPPGTGKTTLVLSVVASYWVSAALSEEKRPQPPVIAAASTNNQAVTNILDAFAKDFSKGEGPFQGRWLPDIASFGAYMPSANKETRTPGKYQTETFYKQIEDAEYFAKARAAYIEAAAAAFPDLVDPTEECVVDRLRTAIREERDKLVAMETAWLELQTATTEQQIELGDDPTTAMAARRQAVSETMELVEDLRKLQQEWEESFLAREGWGFTLFSWFPPVARKRLLLARLFLEKVWPPQLQMGQWHSTDGISPSIHGLLKSQEVELAAREEAVLRGQAKLQSGIDAEKKWEEAAGPVAGDRTAASLTLAECDSRADTVIRFHAFLLATHYWEGRWLLEMESILPDLAREKTRKGRKTLEPRWRRRMKITPCVVTTFYMLPKEMKASRKEKELFVSDYLYDYIDLLIVDEAGQVLPEVGGASFALAKRALVIGDTQQIEPIWSIKHHIDVGNLRNCNVIAGNEVSEQYERISELGKTAASGSVMAISQYATRYHYDRDLARGMFLYEHRRCFNEIIAYCNALCYRHKLVPKRGSGEGKTSLPPIGYLHINGICEQRGSGSRQNSLEAETIAAWIAQHQHSLEQQYGKSVGDIVGVITPFGGQVAAISRACQAAGIAVGNRAGEMTVGTVHSLQGAEREVVIFSPTYSIHADGCFMDRTPSMLNVAVSRAKDAFLAFGDMDIFNPGETGRPRGLLASFLLAKDTNELQFPPLRRKDISQRGDDVGYLHDAEQHDAFLFDLLAKASKEVHIVSPWIRQQQITEVGIMGAMIEAASRGVSITVYADQSLNLDRMAKTEQEARRYWVAVGKIFKDAGINLVDVRQLHSKIVIRDRAVLCIGSFNWLSADRGGRYVRHETSISYSGLKVEGEINVILQSLIQRAAYP